jgi:predicted nucleotidyltransferase
MRMKWNATAIAGRWTPSSRPKGNVAEFTRPATWDDVKRVARLLNDAGAEYALVGGYALGLHGFNRFTQDIDVLVNPSALNSRRWILALASLPDHAAAALEQESDVFASETRYAIRVNDEFTIDVMPSIAGRSWQEMHEHIQSVDLDGVPVKVLDLEGLLLTKQGMRPKDQMDAAVLRDAIAEIRKRK